MNIRFETSKKTIGAALLLMLASVPAFAETDRLTVEDPSTGAVKFKVTSDGNVTGSTITAQQATTEASTVNKFLVKDSTGNDRLLFAPIGYLTLTGGSAAEIHNRNYIDNPAVRPVFVGERARGTATAPTAVQLNDKLGTFAFSGYDGAAFQTGALLEIFVDGTVAAGSVPSRVSIVTGSNFSNRFERLVVKNTGEVGVGTASPTQLLDVNSNGIRIRTAKTPASSSAACNQGEMAWDANFVYVCVATNSWKRSALTGW